jgi:hypothetical protein
MQCIFAMSACVHVCISRGYLRELLISDLWPHASASAVAFTLQLSKQTSYKHNHASSLYQTLAARARPTCKQKFTGRLQRDLAQGRMDHAHRSHETFDPAATGQLAAAKFDHGKYEEAMALYQKNLAPHDRFFPPYMGIEQTNQELCSARTVLCKNCLKISASSLYQTLAARARGTGSNSMPHDRFFPPYMGIEQTNQTARTDIRF